MRVSKNEGKPSTVPFGLFFTAVSDSDPKTLWKIRNEYMTLFTITMVSNGNDYVFIIHDKISGGHLYVDVNDKREIVCLDFTLYNIYENDRDLNISGMDRNEFAAVIAANLNLELPGFTGNFIEDFCTSPRELIEPLINYLG